jgi:hypothetical protein
LDFPTDLKPGAPAGCGLPARLRSAGGVINQISHTGLILQAFGPRLADEGSLFFIPHNPYRGENKFSISSAWPIRSGKSFSRSLRSMGSSRLAGQPAVRRHATNRFYGLSYGGKTAMRVPVLEAIQGRFVREINEWVPKCSGLPRRYMFTGEYEMPEFDLGHTFNCRNGRPDRTALHGRARTR